MKCISKTWQCLCFGCEEDGECYLWRCENPYAPLPEHERKTYAIRSALLALAAWSLQWSWLIWWYWT